MAARKLGKTDIEKKYLAYSKNYKLLFDKDTGFMRGKDENGNFRDECFDPYAWGRDYTEGSAWQNSFGVYHDIKGLDELFSGKLEEKIDELMEEAIRSVEVVMVKP
jgi:putative alpha-1,2-mannosidase